MSLEDRAQGRKTSTDNTCAGFDDAPDDDVRDANWIKISYNARLLKRASTSQVKSPKEFGSVYWTR